MATSTWDNASDGKGGEGSGEVSSMSNVGLYGFSCRNAFTKVTRWERDWNVENSLRRARPGGRSATALVDRAFPVFQSCLHLSQPPPSFPSARRVRGIHRLGRAFHLGNLTAMGENR